MSSLHSAQTVAQGIHIIHAYTYANAAARTAAIGFTTADIGKVALQSDDVTFWLLAAATPTWLPLGALADASVTLAKLANIATDRLIGRDTAGTGVPESISVGGGLEFSGSGGIQRSALTGDVTAAAGSTATTIAAGAVTSTKISDAAVTNAKLNLVASATIKGRTAAGTGAVEDLTGTQATALLDAFTSVLKGLAPASGGGTANFLRADGTWAAPTATVADDSITLAKLANVATGTIRGRATAGTGDPEDLTGTQATALLDVAGALKGLQSAADKAKLDGIGTADLPLGNNRLTGVKNVLYNGEIDDGNSGTSKTIDVTTGGARKLTQTGNCTLTITPPAGVTAWSLKLVQDATGGRTVTWPASVKNATALNAALITTANTTSIVSLYYDGTNHWPGVLCTGVA